MVVKIPEDILNIESKSFGAFTARQWISLGLGLGIIAPTFILLYWKIGSIDLACIVSVLLALPVVASGFIKHHGMYWNRILLYKLRRILKYPQKRKYVTTNRFERAENSNGSEDKTNPKTTKETRRKNAKERNNVEGTLHHSEEYSLYGDL